MYSVEKSNEYVKNYKTKQDDVYRPKYHFSPKVGWCNDPYGIVFFNGVYHVFFQFCPYTLYNTDVHWGHVTTKDFVHFSELECAIVPDRDYDNRGCWSGSAIVKDNKIYIYYTGFSYHKDDDKHYQTVCVAVSEDGHNFTKSELNPIINTNQIPSHANLYDFRDPNVFFEGDKLYLVIGSKNDHQAMALLYSSDDMFHFKFEKTLLISSDYGTMFECPNVVRFEDKAYLIMSSQNIPMKDDNFFNVSSCIYVPLPRDFIREDCPMIDVKEIDHGFDYYAPGVYDYDKIMVAWSQLWGRRSYLAEIGSDWINSFSLFKKIIKDGDELKFVPLSVYQTLFRNKAKFEILLDKPFIKKCGKQFHLDLDVEIKKGLVFTLELTKKDDESVKLILDVDAKKITLDRTSLKEQLGGVDNTPATQGIRWLNLKEVPPTFNFEVYVDSIAVEVYVNDFKDSFHFLSFSLGDDIALSSNIPIKVKLVKHDVIVD